MTSAIEPVKEKVSDQWRTPPEIYAYLNFLYGPFDIDLCASKENSLHEKFFTREENAWRQDWSKIERDSRHIRIFCNPPFSSPNLTTFTDLACSFASREPMATVVGYMPASVGALYFLKNCVNHANEIIFLTGRPAHLDANGTVQSGGRDDMCIVIWDHRRSVIDINQPKVRWVQLKDVMDRGAIYLEQYQDVWRIGEGLKSYLQKNNE